MNTKPETYYDEQEGVEYVYEQADVNHSGKSAVYIVGYFLLLAVLMIPASRFHLGMQGVFFAMVAAGVALLVGTLGLKFVKAKITAMRLTKKGFAQMMVGYTPETVVETEPLSTGSSRALVPVPGVALLPGEADDDLPDTIIEDNPLRLSDTFQPNIQGILGAMLLIVGIRRSGKSNLLAVSAEELARYAVPLVIFDTEDEYSGLIDRQYLTRGVHVGSEDTRKDSPNPASYVAIDYESAYDFGRSILDGGLQVVVNLKSWRDEDAALIMTEIIDGLNDWEEDRDNNRRIPVMVFLDEASKWLPQDRSESYVSKETQTLLHHAFFDIVVARGGKRGFGFVAATQRYSQINKNVLQSLWKFLFLQTEEVDLNRYAKLGLASEDVLALRQGECFIFSPQVVGFQTMIRKRFSPHMGNTPGLDNLTAHTRQLAPMQTVLNRPFAASGVQDRPMREQMAQQAMEPLPMRRQKPKTDAERVLEAYNEHPTASYRELGEKVGMGKDKVGGLIKELRERGLIKPDGGTESA